MTAGDAKELRGDGLAQGGIDSDREEEVDREDKGVRFLSSDGSFLIRCGRVKYGGGDALLCGLPNPGQGLYLYVVLS